jgi:hypothetical protein
MATDTIVFETTVVPPVLFPTTVQLGVQGERGEDASLTVSGDDITAALGYTPVNPASLGSASTHAASDFDAAGAAAAAQSASESAASSALASALAGLASVYQTAAQVSSAISSAISSALTTYATQSWVTSAISSALSSAISALGLGTASTHAASDFDAAGSAAAAAAASIPLTQMGAANGVATLGSDSRIPAAQLPSYVDLVEEVATQSALPTTGASGVIYVTDDTRKIFRWSGSAYVEISPSPGSTDSVTEGSVNLYFTAARAVSALASTLAGYATTSALSSAIAGLSSVYTTTSAVASQITAYGYQTASQVTAAISSAVSSAFAAYTPAKQIFQGFSVSTFDTSVPTFTSGVLTLMTLKSGGASGSTVNTVTYNYTSGQLTSKVLQDGSGNTLHTQTFTYSGSTLVSKVLS